MSEGNGFIIKVERWNWHTNEFYTDVHAFCDSWKSNGKRLRLYSGEELQIEYSSDTWSRVYRESI